jgi:hypothetical protein
VSVDETGTGDVSGMPLMVHLSHKGAGDRFFRNTLHVLEADTCGAPKRLPASTAILNATAVTNVVKKAIEKGGSDGGCMLWCSGSQKDFRQNVHSFTFESPMPRAMRLLGRSYRAVFTVRDPRDLIAEVWLPLFYSVHKGIRDKRSGARD